MPVITQTALPYSVSADAICAQKDIGVWFGSGCRTTFGCGSISSLSRHAVTGSSPSDAVTYAWPCQNAGTLSAVRSLGAGSTRVGAGYQPPAQCLSSAHAAERRRTALDDSRRRTDTACEQSSESHSATPDAEQRQQ